MIKIEITDEELNKLFKDTISKHLISTLKDSNLEYWIRQEVHKIISQEIIDKVIKDKFTHERIEQIMKESFEKYVYDKFNNND